MLSFWLFFLLGCGHLEKRIGIHLSVQKYTQENFKDYIEIYNIISNLVDNGVNLNINSYRAQLFHEYQVDSLFILNENKTKFYTTLNTNFKEYGGSNDYIQSLYGVKIDGKWLLFLGANLIALRESYKYNKYEPFSWDEISYVAHEQMFGRFLSIDSDNNLSINSHLVETEINPWYLAGAHISDEGTDDERFIRLWNYENSQTLDSLEIAQIKQDITEKKVKLYEPVKRLTWWDKLWGAQDPIFETDEWKEYIKSKSSKK